MGTDGQAERHGEADSRFSQDAQDAAFEGSGGIRTQHYLRPVLTAVGATYSDMQHTQLTAVGATYSDTQHTVLRKPFSLSTSYCS